MTRITACPRCRKSVAYSLTNPYRPFCSERCRLIDLGEWADEGYRIPAEKQFPTDEELMEDLEQQEDSSFPED